MQGIISNSFIFVDPELKMYSINHIKPATFPNFIKNKKHNVAIAIDDCDCYHNCHAHVIVHQCKMKEWTGQRQSSVAVSA